MNHRFTIIIPTRERAQTLEHSLQTCIAQDYDDLQILVCDNASQDNTRDVVEAIRDPRIRYVNSKRRLSMMENFEFAFSHVTDGYVYSMGDDDGLPRNAISKVNTIIRETSSRAVISDFAHYMWPNVKGDAAGQLVFSKKKGYEIRQCKSDLNQVLYSRRAFNHLPCVYYGFIEAGVLNQLRQMHGRLFASSIVDLFSSIAISSLIDEYVFSFEPLAINGTSSRSNGAAFMRISEDESEKKNWDLENTATSLPPFQTTASIKMMLAEACYALHKIESPLHQNLQIDLPELLKQAHLDVVLYKRSNIDPELIEKICSNLGYPGLRPNALATALSILELYYHRLPKFLRSEILDTKELDVNNINSAALLLQQHLALPTGSLMQKISLLLKRYRAVR
jgi:glycosyltransferase involved in cell wall biosynthesis